MQPNAGFRSLGPRFLLWDLRHSFSEFPNSFVGGNRETMAAILIGYAAAIAIAPPPLFRVTSFSFTRQCRVEYSLSEQHLYKSEVGRG